MAGAVAIIIVTFNSEEFLPELFASLRAHTDLARMPVLVVDNASTDGTLAALAAQKRELPTLEVLAQRENLGFAGGNNVGLRRARELGVRYAQLLNPDTVVTAGWLDQTVAVLDRSPGVAAAQPLVMLWDAPDRINSAGVDMHFCGFAYCRSYRKRPAELALDEETVPVSFGSGAALLLRLSALDRVGDFDEILFLYLEECDLQLRLRKAGFECVLVPGARILHKYNAEFSAAKYAWVERNRWLLLVKHWPLRLLIAGAPVLVGVEGAVLLFAVGKGWLPEKLQSYREVWRHLPAMLRSRREIRAFRHPEADPEQWLTGRMDFEGLQHPLLRYVVDPVLDRYWSRIRRLLLPVRNTRDPRYAERLRSLEGAWWKRVLDVQAPFRWNLGRLSPGHALEIGCGIGRNLAHLGGRGVGVDHNPHAVAIARARGFTAFLPDELDAPPGSFDSLLVSHVAEHMTFDEAAALLRRYLPLLRPGGQVILMTPQEAGHRSDPTHVEFFDFGRLEQLLRAVGLEVTRSYSFPFARAAGALFKYNEFVVVGRRPGLDAGRAPEGQPPVRERPVA